MKVTLLTGGVGGSKLALGFYHIASCQLTAIANMGDDIVMHGLHVSPDPDILMYTLAGVVNPATGWGFRDETFTVAKGLAGYGRETWFQLGDRDFATHIHRTAMLSSGATLSQAIESIRRSLDISVRVLPMSDDPVATRLDTNEGRMHLQEYFVRRRCEPVVRAIAFEGAPRAKPAPGVVEAIVDADLVVIAPSNPLISIGPILAVPGICDALRRRRDRVVSVCPLVGGKSLKGPTDKMMAQLGYDVSAAAIAAMYSDFCGTMILDPADENACPEVEAAGVRAVVLPTVMQTLEDKIRTAQSIMDGFA
ncbi:MAG TPA: 2-phospho-L-lactate transferase [Micropepsaceae bacterium]|nr:2-phospho-L-lactate transferase [Micropepsaceae bacterium]